MSLRGFQFFYPRIPNGAIQEVEKTLSGRWIGQGPNIAKVLKLFKKKFLGSHTPYHDGSRMDSLNARMDKEYVQNVADVIRGG